MSTILRTLLRLTLLVSFCCLYAINGLAQSQQPTAPVIKFGKVTAADFAPSPTLNDSTAEAEVLYDFGEVRFESSTTDLWMEYTGHRRVRILKKSATSRGTIEVPTFKGLGSEREYLASVDGFTYNLNGAEVSTDKLTKEGRVTERISDKVTMEKFTMPNVREGSIIEYRYVIRTPFATAHNPRTWTFQETIPVRWSEYKITIPNYFYYKIMMGGYLGLAVQEQKKTSVQLFRGESDAPATAYRFALANAPAFRNEKYITTKSDYVSKIDFELASVSIPGGSIRNYSEGWEAMDKTLLEADQFGGQIKRAPFLRDVATLIRTQNPTDSLARLSAAYDFVRKSIKWDETSSYTTNSIKKVFEAKKGDAGDINLLLIALLRELNFEVYPVILSTRSHGRILEEYALMRQFNYVVAQVSTNGQTILLDATDPIIKPGVLPTRCLNMSGRLIAPDSFEITHTLVVPDAYSEATDRIYLWPMLTEARTENPFKEAERLYPVDFGTAIDELYMTTFTLPEGYTVEEMPKPAVLALPDKGGRFTYQVTQSGNTLQVMSRLTLRKTVYFAEEYGALRELFALVVAKHAERVVLKRGEVAKK